MRPGYTPPTRTWWNGRHASLRSWYPKRVCGFESRLPHLGVRQHAVAPPSPLALAGACYDGAVPVGYRVADGGSLTGTGGQAVSTPFT